MNGVDACMGLSPMLKLREQLVTTMDTLKELHTALLNLEWLANDKMKETANQIHFQLGYLTGVLSKLDEEIAKGVQ